MLTSKITKARTSYEESIDLTDLKAAVLPKIHLEWREFQAQAKGVTRRFAIAIEPGGETFRTRESLKSGKLRESGSIRPKAGWGTNAVEACRLEVERRIQRRLHDGFREIVGGKLARTAAAGIDFSKPLPKTIRTPKPEQYIADDEFERLHAAGLTRITRKYDGVGLVLVHHTFGWEAYTLHGNRITDFFPKHMQGLERMTNYGVGTVLKAEAVMFKKEDPVHEDFNLVNGTLNPTRKANDVRREIESGKVPEPSLVVYDILFKDGAELGNVTYDERKKNWEKLPVARGGKGLLLSAEFYHVTPSNWRERRLELGFEGFVLVDGSSTLGKKVISFSSSVPRQKGSGKLKPDREADVVVYAVRKVDGVYESVFIKERYPQYYPGTRIKHPKAGRWFPCGRVSIHGTKEVLKKVDELAKAGRIEVVGSNSEGEKIPVNDGSGVVAVIQYFDRFVSNKFRHARFVQPLRIREGADFKAPEDCVAQYLGEVPAKGSEITALTSMRRGRVQAQAACVA